jgi:outer membrane lipoprotein-sorting protein
MHRLHFRLLLSLFLAAATIPLGGCLFHTRPLDHRPLSDRPLKNATQQELIEYVNTQAAKIQSMQATVDLDASATDVKNGRITDYKEIRGYVLARKPAMLRMKGLLPLVRTTAFDMVSDGKEFKVWIPPSKFVMGSNNADSYQPDKRLENLRPQYVYDALLMPEIGADEIAVMENGYETVLDTKRRRVDQPNYILLVIRKDAQGHRLSRKIEFSRIDLLPYRQTTYDGKGNVATDAHYRNYIDYAGTTFPSTIQIERPRENYDITLKMVKLEINKALADDQFVLEQPSGVEVIRLDEVKHNAAKGPHGEQ